MTNEKIKLKDLVKPGTFVNDALGEAKLNKEGSITPSEMEKIEKRVVENILNAFVGKARTVLKDGDSIEFPGMMNISKSVSSVYKNEHGNLKERLTIRTRAEYMRELNDEL